MKIKTNLALAFSLLVFPLATPLVMAEDGNDRKPATQKTDINPTMEGYTTVSTALYKDDFETAKKAAAAMVKDNKDSPLAKHAQAIADSKSIDEARTHFKELSDVAIPIAKKQGILHVAHCPMAMEGKGADWLQKSDQEIQNPYYGAKMAHCGEFRK